MRLARVCQAIFILSVNYYVGTSGYAYKEWKGKFYANDLPADRMLEFYGSQFSAVEINNTFYRLPAPAVFEKWRDEVPAGFAFAVKAPRRITHSLRLQNAGEAVLELMEAVHPLRKALGPILFQLPPFFKKDAGRLREFLSLRPQNSRWTFEFRHPSWFNQEVLDLLSEHASALCLAEADDDLAVPLVATANWGYLRLRRETYAKRELQQWKRWTSRQKWTDAFVFFKHEEKAHGPEYARLFSTPP